METPNQKLMQEHDVQYKDISLRLKALEELLVGNRLASLEAFSLGSIDVMKEDRRVVQSIRVRLQSLEMKQELEARAGFLETQRLDGSILQLKDNLQPLKTELKEGRHREKSKRALTDRAWDTSGLRERVRSVERRCAAVELELNTAKVVGKRIQQLQTSAYLHEDNALCKPEMEDGGEWTGANLPSARSTVSSVPLAFYGAHPTPPSDKSSTRSPFMHNIRRTQC